MTDVNLQADVPPVPPITVHNKGPITNELLCYVSCKVRICTFDVIVKMCTDFYDSDVIAAAKDDLMGCVTLPEDDKRSGRRRVNLKEVHMKDIVSIFLEIKPEDVPVFLAGDLNNVPPMSLNNFDMSRIITDMEVLKSQMKIIQEAQETALSTNDNNGSVSSDGDNDGHHVTTVDDADADIIRLAQTQGLIPDHIACALRDANSFPELCDNERLNWMKIH